MEQKKIKVLYIITKGNFGGAQRYVFDLATSLPKDQFDVSVAFGEGEALNKKLKEQNIRTIKIQSLFRNVNIFKDIKVFFELLKILKQEKPDVIHLNSSKIGGLGALAGRVMGVKKIIFTGHGWAFNEDRNIFSKTIITFIHWLTIILTHKTIAVSEKTASQLRKIPFTSKKIIVIHNGIASFEIFDKNFARNYLAQENPKLNEFKNDLWIGTISELHKNKGLVYAIEAINILVEKYPSLRFIIIGEGEERVKLEKIIKDKKLENNVFLLGFVFHAEKYLKAFDIFTLTSITEGLPYVILEAGFASLPVIATKVGGIPEIINNAGIMIKPRDASAIEQELKKLLSSQQLQKEFGEELNKRVLTIFSLEHMIKETINIYKR
ncbi:MAG: glycosyltransferase family 4 protein [Candidatus Paceibacterota bacterium]